MEVASPIPKKHARIEIIPLIDIMFFLLASFMMVSLSQTTMKGMKVNLPVGSSGQTQSKKDYVSFSVDRDGFIYFDTIGGHDLSVISGRRVIIQTETAP